MVSEAFSVLWLIYYLVGNEQQYQSPTLSVPVLLPFVLPLLLLAQLRHAARREYIDAAVAGIFAITVMVIATLLCFDLAYEASYGPYRDRNPIAEFLGGMPTQTWNSTVSAYLISAACILVALVFEIVGRQRVKDRIRTG